MIGIVAASAVAAVAAPPQFIDAATASPGQVASVTVTIPATVQAGDLLLAVFAAQTGYAIGGTPAGWTALATWTSSIGGKGGVYKKTAAGGDAGGTVTMSVAGSGYGIVGGVAVYRGVDVAAVTASGGAGWTAPSITVPANSIVGTVCMGVDDTYGGGTASLPAGTTNRLYVTDQQAAVRESDELLVAGGASTARTFSGGEIGAAYSVAIPPAA